MIRKLLKKSFIYTVIKQYKKKEKNRQNFIEITKRIKENTLLKDLTKEELDDWTSRINTVLACPDNDKISCVAEAGTFKNELLVMHNGLQIEPLSYYGYAILDMLLKNKGIHEPQEEYVFQEVLKEMPAGATMIELGAYWSFYSMWFNKLVSKAQNYMIEPINMNAGIYNFKLNNLKGKFFNYFISDAPKQLPNGAKAISVDSFIADNNIGFVDILHSDIQGDELDMLNGATHLINEKKVGYIFISTHSNELHTSCASFLNNLGYLKVCDANLDESFSHDGLLVFKNPDYKGTEKVNISLKH